jgi:SAM-dependent methyltransferase
MNMSYLETVETVYSQAAATPDASLCCVPSTAWRLPDLHIPPLMLQMNYGCGSTVDPREVRANETILYVGVGGGLEALQFAYLTRRPGGVIAVDPVAPMRERARANFEEAARLNAWFRPEFITLLPGNALDLPVPAGHVTVLAQNCLFNVFAKSDLQKALSEVIRVLRVGGRFYTSDPIAPVPLPDELRDDATLRARCISGCLTFEEYVTALTDAGFGRVEVRARFPYRNLHPREYPALSAAVMLESVEIAAHKVPAPVEGPAIFTGRTATYCGDEELWNDGLGNHLRRGIPTPLSDAAARRLAGRDDIVLTEPTFHSRSGGCC